MGLGAVLLVAAFILLFILIDSYSHQFQCPVGNLGGCPTYGVPPPPSYGLVVGALLGPGVVAAVYGALSGPSLRPILRAYTET